MDRPQLSATIISELAELFAETLRRNGETLLKSDLDGMEQRIQELARTVFGPVIEHTIAAVAATMPSEPPDCPHCHQTMRPVDYARSRSLKGWSAIIGSCGPISSVIAAIKGMPPWTSV